MHYCVSEKFFYANPAFGPMYCLPPLLFKAGLQGETLAAVLVGKVVERSCRGGEGEVRQTKRH